MKKMFFVFLMLGVVGLLSLYASPALAVTAQECEDLYGGNPDALTNCLNTAEDSIHILKPTGAIGSINSLISGGVTLILIVAGLVAFVYLLLGGIKWITSGGDSGQVEAARNQVIHALIGVIVVLAAWGLIMLIQGATGACFGIGCTVSLPVFE